MRDELADRMRKIIGADKAVTEQAMFGGLCFMRNGNMQICARRDGSLLARVGVQNAAEAVKRPGVTQMVMRGKPMADYLIVAADQLTDKALRDWVAMTGAYVASLPPKAAKAKKN